MNGSKRVLVLTILQSPQFAWIVWDFYHVMQTMMSRRGLQQGQDTKIIGDTPSLMLVAYCLCHNMDKIW